MHVDQYGLPVQADGDKQDQLNRVGLVLLAHHLLKKPILGTEFEGCWLNEHRLEPARGIYTRYVGSPDWNVSCDQLIPILCYRLASRDRVGLIDAFMAMLGRLGFSQNYRTLDGKLKIPDLMAFRTLPIFCRIHWCLYPLICLVDVLLLVFALGSNLPVWPDDSFRPRSRSQDDVDDNNLIATLWTAREILPTPLSIGAIWIYTRIRPLNYGVTLLKKTGNVNGAMHWYHRSESGGNPEIATLWEPLILKYEG